ncbi:MAG: HIT family protein [Candidatus Liptonbacteria bacterium]
MEENCLFCKVARKELPAHIIYEDADSLAFLDIHPKAPGHTVVIPKVHAQKISALPEKLVGPVFQAVQKVATRLSDVLAADGLTIGINQGPVSGQTVPHLHIHLMPRFTGDHGGSIHSVVDNPPKETLESLKDRIKF